MYPASREMKNLVNKIQVLRLKSNASQGPQYHFQFKVSLKVLFQETVVFVTRKSVHFCEFLRCFLKTRNTQVTFTEKQQIKKNSLNLTKALKSNSYLFRKSFNCKSCLNIQYLCIFKYSAVCTV